MEDNIKTRKVNQPNKEYLKFISETTPKTHQGKTLFYAFLVGGAFCCVGQFFRDMLEMWAGLKGDMLAGAVSIIMIFIGATLTGLGVYDRIGKLAGAGSIVPITGFANSVVSPAMEFKSEGMIYGLAAKMFVIAGPIIVYGIVSSVAVGIIYSFFY